MRKQRNPKLIDFLRILTKSNALSESSEVSIVCPGLCSLDSLRAFDFVSIRKKSINLGFLCFLIPYGNSPNYRNGNTCRFLRHGFPIWTHELQYLSCQSRQWQILRHGFLILCSLDSLRAFDFVSIRKKSINLGFLCFLIPFVYTYPTH
jgi:hypothetical protein